GHLTAYALVALGRHPYTDWTGRLSAHDEAVVRWAMEAVGAKPLAARPISELSDGERQKIMIARALAQEPLVMLLDEPTAFLDLPNRVEIMRVLRALTRQTGRAILLSTHDLDLALRSADRLWLLPHGGPLHDGAPEDLVLSGALEATFRSEGIAFDRQTGTFAIVAAHTGCVALAGEGVTALWTRRALEREGYRVADDGAEAFARVEVLDREGNPRWRCTASGVAGEYGSLHALIAALRATQG
ncbi:MAG: ABC transporter ATP-binding protein, partial [Planctomycetota bacterium]